MKILFLTHYYPPEGNAPASRTHETCRRWAAAGHEVEVITCVPNVPDGKVYAGYRNALHQVETLDGVRVHRVWTYVAPNKGAVRRILNYLSYLVSALLCGLRVRRPNVLLCTSPQFFCGIAGVVLGRWRAVPTILEIRDIWPESIETVGAMRKGFALRLLERLERWMYRRADHVVTVGKGYWRKLVERGVPEAKLSIVTNGADVDLFKPGPPDPELRERLGVGTAFTAAYVGTLGMACGLDVVLDAAAMLRDRGEDGVRFLLVGDGARREELEARARDLGVQDLVRFTGRLPKEQIAPLLRTVDACLIHLEKSPLFTTVIPSKMFEAFATAKPVLLGVDGHAREILEEAGAGLFFEPGDAPALLAAVERLRSDPAACARMGREGLRQVHETYNRDRLAAAYLEIVSRVAAGQQAAAVPARTAAPS
jgi:glycosyltransferase involved in cell wall biosynthesis